MTVSIRTTMGRLLDFKATNDTNLLADIHKALDLGYPVHCHNVGYKVIRDSDNNLLVSFSSNNYVALHYTDDNGTIQWNHDKRSLFYIGGNSL